DEEDQPELVALERSAQRLPRAAHAREPREPHKQQEGREHLARAPQRCKGDDYAVRQARRLAVSAAATLTAAAATAAATAAVAARRTILLRARWGILRPLDQLLGLDEVAVLVLGDQLEPD